MSLQSPEVVNVEGQEAEIGQSKTDSQPSIHRSKAADHPITPLPPRALNGVVFDPIGPSYITPMQKQGAGRDLNVRDHIFSTPDDELKNRA